MNAFLPVTFLSLKVALTATLVLIPTGTFLGWVLARKQFPGKTLVEGAISIPLVLPPVVTGYMLLILLGPKGYIGEQLAILGIRLAFTWQAAVVAAATVSLPLMVRAVRLAVEGVDEELEDAARLLRASETGIFFSITLPLAVHGILAGTILSFARALGEFGATIILASNIEGVTQTIPLAIFTYLNQVDGEGKAMILVGISICLAYLSILASAFLSRKFRHAET